MWARPTAPRCSLPSRDMWGPIVRPAGRLSSPSGTTLGVSGGNFCCAVEKSIHTDKCPDYLHNSSSSFPLCLLSWGSKVFHLAESKRATLPFVSHRNSTELCTQYHHSFSFIFFYSTSVCSAVNTNRPSLQFVSLYSRMWGLRPRDSWLFTVDY